MVPPKVALLDYVGTTKGRTAIGLLHKFCHLKEKPYWGNLFWSRGYCVDTGGLDSEMIPKYVKYQQDKERRTEQNQKKLFLFQHGTTRPCLLRRQGRLLPFRGYFKAGPFEVGYLRAPDMTQTPTF